MNAHKQDDWSDSERIALRALAREETVSSSLADSTVAALHTRGLLRRGSQRRTWLPIAATAAALALFAGGFALGQTRGIRTGHELAMAAMTATPDDDADELAFVLQRTGSAYLRALSALAELDAARASPQATEAAITITEAALDEVSEIARDSTTRNQLVRRIEANTASQSIWY
jgi:hypothetical protein